MALSLALRSRFISNLNRIVSPIISTSNRNVSNNPKSVYKTEEAKKIRFYILNQFIEFVKNYDKVLEKNFPVTWKTYKVFTEGIRLFIVETREYFRIVKVLNSPGGNYTKLLRREIELYEQMPKDMMKVAPVLAFSTLPFAFYVLLPLVYALPKQVLTSHFWTLEQKYTFGIENLRNRLLHNKPVLRHLQSQLPYIKRCEKDQTVVYEWDKVLGYLGSGVQPRVEDVLACKELFMDEPYHLLYLSRNHIGHLLKVHNIHIGWFRRTRLADRALILIEMDKAIMREGGVHNLPLDALRKSCYLRGLNPSSLSTDYMVRWMKQWIKVSSQIDKDSLSLLLHCPILFGYNEPTNWGLIYPIK